MTALTDQLTTAAFHQKQLHHSGLVLAELSVNCHSNMVYLAGQRVWKRKCLSESVYCVCVTVFVLLAMLAEVSKRAGWPSG